MDTPLKETSCTVCGSRAYAFGHERYPFCFDCLTLGKAFNYIKKISVTTKCRECSTVVEAGVLIRTKGLLCNSCYSSHMMNEGTKVPKATITKRKPKMSEQNTELASDTQAPVKKKRTVIRLGQTKLIDKLLEAGNNDEQVIEEVKKQIPQYPAEKLPQLVKIRKAHLKKKAQQTTA